MLFFVVHAFVVGATHLHARVEPFVPSFAPPSHSVGGGEKVRDDSDAAGHFQCLLCRLQRSLDADLGGLRPASAAPLSASSRAVDEADPLFLDNSTLAPAGRAPPLT